MPLQTKPIPKNPFQSYINKLEGIIAEAGKCRNQISDVQQFLGKVSACIPPVIHGDEHVEGKVITDAGNDRLRVEIAQNKLDKLNGYLSETLAQVEPIFQSVKRAMLDHTYEAQVVNAAAFQDQVLSLIQPRYLGEVRGEVSGLFKWSRAKYPLDWLEGSLEQAKGRLGRSQAYDPLRAAHELIDLARQLPGVLAESGASLATKQAA